MRACVFNSATNASGTPAQDAPADHFSVKWTGRVLGLAEGEHAFFVSADAGAGFRLKVSGMTLIENWTNPSPNAIELSVAFGLSPDSTVNLELDYKEGTGAAQVRLAWIPPGGGSKVAIPRSHLQGRAQGKEATGVSVDAAGKVWAGCYGWDNVMRIDPEAGDEVVIEGVTNYVGAVDLEVDLGNGTGHSEPYNVEAQPYNYSDMTGFNNRIVNPGGQPLKGYWTAVEDCGLAGEWWRAVTWTDNLPLSGCGIEVQVRAAEDRQELVNQTFAPVTNGGAIVGVKGRFIEVRVALTRDEASKQPVLYDLTLWASSSGFVGDLFLEDWPAYETENAWFSVNLIGPKPLTYQWYVMPPWTNEWAAVSNVTSPELVLTNVDLWDDWTLVGVTVSNAAGETVWLGPAVLSVFPLPMQLQGSGSSGSAERYPATIHVRGEPTNGLARVELTLHNLTHYYPADLDILLVSPSGTKIMLMSDAGSYVPVTNATLVFHPTWYQSTYPPESSAIPSSQELDYRASNFGEQEGQLPGAPAGPYLTDLVVLETTDSNPNGIWELYIYDDKTGQTGVLQDSWSLKFYYQQ